MINLIDFLMVQKSLRNIPNILICLQYDYCKLLIRTQALQPLLFYFLNTRCCPDVKTETGALAFNFPLYQDPSSIEQVTTKSKVTTQARHSKHG